MKALIKNVNRLKESRIRHIIDKRLAEFQSLHKRSSKQWFSELCFCLLTANSKAKTAMAIQKELGVKGFCEARTSEIKKSIIKNKHRFHNTKTRYIISARKFIGLKKIIKSIAADHGEAKARDWLAENVKGIGYKEASHFLRNVGYKSLAIVDRHIMDILAENKIINKKLKIVTKKKYIEVEDRLRKLAQKMDMQLAELDLYLWFMKTGEVLK